MVSGAAKDASQLFVSEGINLRIHTWYGVFHGTRG